MKANKKTIILCTIVLFLVIVAVFAAYYVFRSDQESDAEYRMIYEYDFNDPDNAFGKLITNSYSEEGTEFAYDPTGGLDGSGCIVIKSTSPNDARFTFPYEKAYGNTYYRVSAWIRTENVGAGSLDGKNTPVGANVSILNTYNHSVTYSGTNDWTYVEYYGKTSEDQLHFTVCLRLGFYGGVNTGAAYFDDLKIEQLDKLPEGAVYNSMEDAINGSTKLQADMEHQDTMLTATILLVFLALFFIVVYRYAKKSDTEARQLNLPGSGAANGGISVRNMVLLLIGVGFILRIFMSFTMPQCDIDVNLFQNWARNLSEQGIPDFYAYAAEHNLSLDYPPLFMYHLYIIGKISNIGGIAQSALFDVLLKFPSLVADCVIAYLLYKISSKHLSKNWIFLIVSIWLFNPMVLLDSACWGQVDSLLTLALLLSAYFLEKDRYVWASVALAFAVTLKPQGIFFVPILGFALLRQLFRERELPLSKRLLRFAYSISAFFIAAFLIILPFGIKAQPNIFSWIIGVYTNTAGGYSYATVNSFNFFYLMGANWVSDGAQFMGLTYFTWGMIAIVLLSLLTGVLYIYGKKKNTYVYLLSSMLIYTVATFGPRMHERYFYPAIALLLVAVIYSNNKLLLGIYGVMTISNFYTVLEVMTGLSIGGALINTDYQTASYYYWPPLNPGRTMMGLFNVLCAVALLAVSCMMIFTDRERQKRFRIWEEIDETYDGTNGDAYEE